MAGRLGMVGAGSGPSAPTATIAPVRGAPVTDLVRRASTGDQAAWDALVDRFSGLVWSVTRAFRLSAADASDVSQITWLRLVEHLATLREPEAVAGWLVTTARRECLGLLRRSGRQAPAEDDQLERAMGSPGANPVDVDERLLHDELAAAVWQAFADLSGPCQLLLRLLTEDPPLSYEAISAAIDRPIGSIGPTRARCLDRLRGHPAVARISEP